MRIGYLPSSVEFTYQVRLELSTLHKIRRVEELEKLHLLRRKAVQIKISRGTTQRSRTENIFNEKKVDHFNIATLKGKGFTEVYTRGRNLGRHLRVFAYYRENAIFEDMSQFTPHLAPLFLTTALREFHIKY